MSDLTDLLNAVGAITGGTQTQTTSNSVSSDKAKTYMNDLISGNGGLASILAAGRGSGWGKSSTAKLASEDLIAKAAAQTAALSSDKTVTTSTQGLASNPMVRAASGAGALYSMLGGKTGITGYYDKAKNAITDLLSSDSGATTSAVSDAYNNAFSGALSTAGVGTSGLDMGSVGTAIGDAASSAGDWLSSVTSDWGFASGGYVPKKIAGTDSEVANQVLQASSGQYSSSNNQAQDTSAPTGHTYSVGSIVGGVNSLASMGKTIGILSAINPVLGLAYAAYKGVDLGNKVGKQTAMMGLADESANAIDQGMQQAISMALAANQDGLAADNTTTVGQGNQGGATGSSSNGGGGFSGWGNSGLAGAMGGFGAADSGASGGYGGGSDGSSGTAATGGFVQGDNNKGVDDRIVKLDGGEFVIPAKVVDAIGVDKFQNLIAQFGFGPRKV
jgi:hypothetical protein